MNANTGTGAGGHENYAGELRELRRVLNDVEVVGYPKQDRELAELERLISTYPDQARRLVADLDGH